MSPTPRRSVPDVSTRITYIVRGALIAALLVVAPAAQAGEIVALGDSYSSGEGTAPYDADTDRRGDHKCHRSPNGWPRLIGVSSDRHLACSGAKIAHVSGGRGKTRSAPDNRDQVSRLRELAATTAIDRVVLGIGGNDMNFAGRMKDCYLWGSSRCLTDIERVGDQLGALRPRLVAAYRAVSAAAGAPVLVVGYPDILPAPSVRTWHRCAWLTKGMKQRAERFSELLDGALSGAAAEAGVSYLSMRDVLKGHELCTGRSYIRALGGKPGDITGDQQQGHPLYEGQLAMALAVQRWLAANRTTCTPGNSLAAIVDDSGSMEENDPNGIRRRALELLLTKPANQSRVVSATEFGEDAGSIFGPQAVGPNQSAMLSSLGVLRNDGLTSGGSTDYNAAFAASAAAHAGPSARVFLTDGQHNEGPYEDPHVGGPPTYVIGLNIGPPEDGSDEAALLQRIADQTGGRYFPLKLSPGDGSAEQLARLQPALNEIDSRIGCSNVQTENTVALTAAGKPSRGVSTLFDGQPAMEIVASWADPGVAVEVASITVRDSKRRVVGDLLGAKRVTGTTRRRAKLEFSVVRGATFSTITLKRPKYGRAVTITLKAPTLGSPTPVTVQLRPVAAAPVPEATVLPGASTVSPGDPQPTVTTTTPSPPPPPPPPPRARVNAYDNYGGGAVGRAMCRGNPANGLSMPGGTVTQTFTVGPGVASLDHALVQIDPDTRVTAHATLFVNGAARASTAAAAVGDTHFSFGDVAVRQGDSVMLRISFTATFGKIITVYTVGAPGGTFSTANSCPDGAPSVTTSATGLRAVFTGWNR